MAPWLCFVMNRVLMVVMQIYSNDLASYKSGRDEMWMWWPLRDIFHVSNVSNAEWYLSGSCKRRMKAKTLFYDLNNHKSSSPGTTQRHVSVGRTCRNADKGRRADIYHSTFSSTVVEFTLYFTKLNSQWRHHRYFWKKCCHQKDFWGNCYITAWNTDGHYELRGQLVKSLRFMRFGFLLIVWRLVVLSHLGFC